MAIYRKCGKCGKRLLQLEKCECLKETAKEYNKKIRCNNDNVEHNKFYKSPQWTRARNYIRVKYSSLCLLCYAKYKILIEANVVHHIVELKEDYSKRLDEDNLIPLCHSCHNVLHRRYGDKEKHELYIAKKIYEEEFL